MKQYKCASFSLPTWHGREDSRAMHATSSWQCYGSGGWVGQPSQGPWYSRCPQPVFCWAAEHELGVGQAQPSPLSPGVDAKSQQLIGQKLATPTHRHPIVQVKGRLWFPTVCPPSFSRLALPPAQVADNLWLYITFCVFKWENLTAIRDGFSEYQG